MSSWFADFYPFSLLVSLAASFPKGTPFGSALNLPAGTKAVPLGKVASPQAMTEGVKRQLARPAGWKVIFFPKNA